MSKKEKEVKTNAMRILDKNKVPYEVVTYTCEEFIDGIHIADQLGQAYEISFKTLVTVGKSGEHYVFVLPVDKEVDFKKAAKCAGEKSGRPHPERSRKYRPRRRRCGSGHPPGIPAVR